MPDNGPEVIATEVGLIIPSTSESFAKTLIGTAIFCGVTAESLFATGRSLTSVTVIVTVAVSNPPLSSEMI